MPKEKNEPVYQTESELKAELLKKRDEQAKLDALRKPLSPRKKKWDNYWYHYKWHTIGGVIALCLAVFVVRDLVFRENPDATIELISSGYIAEEARTALEAALEEAIPDGNGDGETILAIDFIQLGQAAVTASPDGSAADPGAVAGMGMGDPEAEYAAVMKFSAVLASNGDPLFLVDEAVYNHMLEMTADESGVTENLFAATGFPGAEGERLPFSATSLAEVPGLGGLDGLYFCIRLNNKTGEKDIAYYDYCMEALRTLAS